MDWDSISSPASEAPAAQNWDAISSPVEQESRGGGPQRGRVYKPGSNPEQIYTLPSGRKMTRAQMEADLAAYNQHLDSQQADPTFADRFQAANAGAARGAAALAGIPVDTGLNILDLAKAGAGYLYSKATGSPAPDWSEPTDRSNVIGSSQQITGLLNRGGVQTEPSRPEDTASQFLSTAGEMVPSSMVPGQKGPAAPVKFATPAEQAIAAGEKHGVPVFFDDVSASPTARKVGVALEPLGSFGTGGGRAVQAVAAKDAASRVVSKFAPQANDDVPELIQQGLKTKLQQFRTAADKLYGQAAAALDPAGAVTTSQMDSTIQRELARQQGLGTLSNPAVTELLQKYQQAPRGNFSMMRELRSQIGSDISDFYTGANKTIGEKGVGALQAMKDALDADMSAFAKAQGGSAEAAWRRADGFYRANIVPFKEAGFRDLAKTAEPEKAWRYLLAQGGLKSRAARMYNSLDESGRGAVRFGMVKDAMEAGTNPNGSFSPAKFAKYMEDHQPVIDQFFRGSELQEIKGFQNLMRHVERAGQFAENPPTGQRLVPYLLAGLGYLSVKGAATATATGVTVQKLFQTEAGRNLLLGMAKVTPGSRPADVLSGRVATFLASQSAQAGTGGAENARDARTAR